MEFYTYKKTANKINSINPNSEKNRIYKDAASSLFKLISELEKLISEYFS